MSKLYIIDLSMMLYRFYHSIPAQCNSKGEPVNAVLGCTKSIVTTASNADHIIFCMDSKNNFRKDIYPEYKSNRSAMNDDLLFQLGVIKEFIECAGIKISKIDTYEADDIIASYAHRMYEHFDTIVIFTTDKDMIQSVNDKTHIWNPYTKKIINLEYVRENYYIEDPKLWIDIQAIAGDSSDNIPGIHGIGIKGAVNLISEYGSLESVLENANSIKSTSMKNKILTNGQNAIISKELVLLRTNVNIEYTNPQDLKFQWPTNADGIVQFIERYEIPSLNKQLQDLNIISTEVRNEVGESDQHTYDKGYFESNYAQYDPTNPGQESKISIIYDAYSESISLANVLFEDIYIMGYVVHGVSMSLDDLQSKYGCTDSVELFYKLNYNLWAIKAHNTYYNLEKPTINILKAIRNHGIVVDKDKLESYRAKYEEANKIIEAKILEIVGVKFLINSPKQVIAVFKDKLQINIPKTDNDVLSKIEHPVAKYIIEWRSNQKILSDQLSSYSENVKGDIVNPIFLQASTSTGRLSSTTPNMQNVPKEIRDIFVSRKGTVFIGMDYNQLELRVISCIASVSKFIEGFQNNADIHYETANKIFHTDNITPALRNKAKAINFGVLYGMSASGIYKRGYTQTLEEARLYLHNYFEAYPEIQRYWHSTINDWNKHGYLQTITKRRITHIRNNRSAINAPIQGSAADIIKYAMIKIHRQIHDLKIVLQVHDELLFEVQDDNNKDQHIQAAKHIMENACSSFSKDLHLKVDVKIGYNWKDMNPYSA